MVQARGFYFPRQEVSDVPTSWCFKLISTFFKTLIPLYSRKMREIPCRNIKKGVLSDAYFFQRLNAFVCDYGCTGYVNLYDASTNT